MVADVGGEEGADIVACGGAGRVVEMAHGKQENFEEVAPQQFGIAGFLPFGLSLHLAEQGADSAVVVMKGHMRGVLGQGADVIVEEVMIQHDAEADRSLRGRAVPAKTGSRYCCTPRYRLRGSYVGFRSRR